jgi:hypothetical protein
MIWDLLFTYAVFIVSAYLFAGAAWLVTRKKKL